jgi:hypothetical protein
VQSLAGGAWNYVAEQVPAIFPEPGALGCRIKGVRTNSMIAMMQNRFVFVAGLLAAAMVAAGLSGCRVHVDKDQNGEEKTVQVDTPFGGVHVNTDQTTATDLGLPVYPGAITVKDDEKHKSADVHLGFGEWQLRVRAVSYASTDTRDQLTEFYKKALGRYGDVITCRDHQPVGTPAVTSEGLTCSDDEKSVKVDLGGHKNGISSHTDFELKAGSKRHQHIVGFEEAKAGQTRFSLVALDLPAEMGGKGGSD